MKAAAAPGSVLIVKPSSLGDVVHTLPAVACVKAAWPEAKLRWIVNPEWAPLLEGNLDLDEVIVFPRKELGGVTRVFKQIDWIRKIGAQYRSDLVLDFQGLLRSAIIGRACRGGSLVGLSDAREGSRFFYDQAAPVHRSQHAVERYLKIVETLGIPVPQELRWPLPAGNEPDGAVPEAPFVLLHPFSRGAGKSLSVEDVRQFCEAMPHPVVLAGRTDLATGLIDRLPNVTSFLNVTSLSELIWLIRRARFVVSVDSGPMHIAAALGKPLLSIHTWSDPSRVGPYDPEAWILRDRTLFQMRDRNNRLRKPPAAPDWESVAHFVTGRLSI